MERKILRDTVKSEYFLPIVEVIYLVSDGDVLCLSNEGNDNDFDAGELGL